MPKLTVSDLDRELRNKKLRSVYLIYGVEGYLADTALSRIRAYVAALSGAEKFQPERFSGRDTKPVDIMTAATTLSMWFKHNLIVVSEADAIKDPEGLVKYLGKPSPSSTVVFMAEKADGRTKFVQACQEYGGVVECKPLYENQIPDWLRMESSSRGKTISMEAARFMGDIVGRSLGDLSSALDKLALYVGKKPTIDLSDVELVLTETGERTVFELSNAVFERNFALAMHILKRLEAFGESEIMILNMLARHLRLLLKTKESGVNDSYELARVIGVNPFFAKDYLKQARLFALRELKADFKRLYMGDKMLKSARLPKWAILTDCVKGIIGL